MRVFAGKWRRMLRDRHNGSLFRASILSPSLSWDRPTRCNRHALKGPVMLPLTRTIATLASVAAVACGLFAFSWVSLALLGF
jgi:hypothetical protein